ncbi:MAG: sensor histidine kinase [Deltaproteobacteria bacterium]|nr:sensor histidine kinase [Deltaproteobacteria bacterium]
MSKGRLTRQELSWLLTQEAQNAAERLRVGVQVLRTQAPPAMDPTFIEDPAHHVDASLDALDDVMKMLSNLNQRQSSSGLAVAARRGRIDLAALIVEVAPAARVSIEPGSGTEVYGDEADFRRMLQVLIGHGTGEGSTVTVRRDGEDVRIATVLGPDSSPTAETERAWLARMAMRYGGRHELEGGTEVLVLPAEMSADRSEREALRRELDEARKQGEAYARELAAVFDRGEEVVTVSSVPPAPGVPSADRFETITKLCAGISSELRATLGPLAKELASLRRAEVTDEQLDLARRRVAHARELAASLRSIGNVPPTELATEIDLVEIAKVAAREGADFGERGQVKVVVKAAEGARYYVRAGAKALTALVRELVAHAVAASPNGGTVEVSVSEDPSGVRLCVDDAGPALPASGRRGFLALEQHAGAYGRPSGLPIFMASELAGCLGARLELSDAPPTAAGGGGGVRVAVTFTKA